MNLTPEHQAIGKENFFAAIGSNVPGPNGEPPRREFLEQRIQDGLELGGLPGHAYFGYADYEETFRERGPVRVGVIGTGDEGSVLIGALNPKFLRVKSIADIRPYSQYRAFHGDVYSPAAVRGRPGLLKVYGCGPEVDPSQFNSGDDVFGQVKKSRAEAETLAKDYGLVAAEERARMDAGEIEKDPLKVYESWEELLGHAREDGLEAVIIALPLHLHAKAAIAAMQTVVGEEEGPDGTTREVYLHVLTEKLMAHSVPECKDMVRAAKQSRVHLATGHQRHYNVLYENAVDLIRRGLLGEIHCIRAQWHRGNLPDRDSWKMPMPEKVKPKDTLWDKLGKELESWTKKLKPLKDPKERLLWAQKVAQKEAQIRDDELGDKAKNFDYEDKMIDEVYDRPAIEELIRWRLWQRTGGGLMAELGSHQLDAASIFLAAMHGQKVKPLNVGAVANRPLFGSDREIEDHVYCVFEFPGKDYKPDDPEDAARNRVGVQYASINGNGFGGYGETVLGTKGTLLLTEEKEVLLFETAATDRKVIVKTTRDKAAEKDVPAIIEVEKDDEEEYEKSAAIGRMALKDAGRGYQQELEHWAWCIRKNPANDDPNVHPRCYPEIAMADAVIALTTNIAAREQRRIEFEKSWFDPDSDDTPEQG